MNKHKTYLNGHNISERKLHFIKICVVMLEYLIDSNKIS